MARKLKRKKLYAEILISLGIIGALVFGYLFIKQPLFYFGILASLLLIFIGRVIFKQLKETIAEQLIPEVYQTKLGRSIYRPKEGFNPGDVYQTNLFLPQERFISYDLVSGEVFGFKYKLSEIQFLDIKKDFKKFFSDVLFQGMFIEVNVESKIKGSVYIVPKQTTLHRYLDKENLVKVSDDINALFDVYSKNKKEVEKLFSDEFREVLLKIVKQFPTIFIAVKKHAIYFGIDSRKKPLEVKLFKKLDMSYLDTLASEIITVKEVVYTLYKK